ncbi:unnamed protein product [Dovyalis caffra]|uniref:Uncharacterized protein n=1 Tax=Dovyalis caffra TaxID=77055 RepID=A0AAV1SC82_9ROSI|nr:unnamed protein product [Dovyalis caffra]
MKMRLVIKILTKRNLQIHAVQPMLLASPDEGAPGNAVVQRKFERPISKQPSYHDGPSQGHVFKLIFGNGLVLRWNVHYVTMLIIG